MTSPIPCIRLGCTPHQMAQKVPALGIRLMPQEDSGGGSAGLTSAIDIFIAVQEGGWETVPWAPRRS